MNANPAKPSDSTNIVPLHAPNRPELTRIDPNGKPASPTATLHRFKYAGQQWRLTRRGTAGAWYLAFERDETRYRASMKTTSRAQAELEAKSHLDAFLKRRRDDRSGLTPKTQPGATVGDLARVLPRLTIAASPKTRAEYLANLERCLVHALDCDRAQVASVSLDRLNDAAGARFFAWLATAAAQLPSQADANRLRKSWISMFQTANALFSPRALYQFQHVHGLVLPDLTDWRHAAKIHGPKLPRASGPAIPDDAILRRTLIEWVKLGRTPGYECRNRDHRRRTAGHTTFERGPLTELDRRNMFLAIGLELACGLRKSESPRACWGWIKNFNGVPHLSELDTTVKNATGEISIVPVNPFWRFLIETARRNGWRGAPHEPLLTARATQPGAHPTLNYSTGGHTDASYWPFAHIGWWLRDLGWETTKTNHALRDYSASMITMRYSLADASFWCRHSSLLTTQRSYNRFVRMATKVNPKTLAWLNWAQ